MATVTSQLIFRLIDGITGPAKKAAGALRGLDRTARGLQGSRAFARNMDMGVRRLIEFGGAVAVARTAVKAYKDFADFDRSLTRIGITADATKEQMQGLGDRVKKIANDVGLSTSSVVEGLDSLVAAGRSLPDAMSFLPAVARTAQAAGAEVTDIAKTADALGSNLEITGDKMQRAFDILVAGGKAGKFELKDMARELPSIAAMAAQAGLKGEDGLRKLVAMLQVVRTQTGSGEEAANRLVNVFQKMNTAETIKRFSKMGVDLTAEMEKAKKNGESMIDAFVRLSEKAIGGDMTKLPQLFGDLQVLQGMQALITKKKEVDELNASLAKVDGTTIRDLAKVTDDASASVTRLSNAWGNMLQSMGQAMDAGGVTEFLNALGTGADALTKSFQSGSIKPLDDWYRKGTPDLQKRIARDELSGIDREVELYKARRSRSAPLPEDAARDADFYAAIEKRRQDLRSKQVQIYAGTREKAGAGAVRSRSPGLKETFGPAIPGGTAPSIPPIDPRSIVPKAALEAAGQEAGASAAQATGASYAGNIKTAGYAAVLAAGSVGQAVKSALEVTATPRIVMPTLPMAGTSYGRGPQPPPGRAAGGPVRSGHLYQVGERGRELFMPGRSGTVIPNGKIPRGGVTVGDIHVHGVQDPAGFAAAVRREISSAVRSGFRGAHGDLGTEFV